jgi:hypothetical protein
MRWRWLQEPRPADFAADPRNHIIPDLPVSAPCSQQLGVQSFDPPILLSVADFEQLLIQGGIDSDQPDDANCAIMDCNVFITCLRQQVLGMSASVRVLSAYEEDGVLVGNSGR